MINYIFCEMTIKKLSTEGRPGGMGNHPNFFLEVGSVIILQYLLWYPSILHGNPSNIQTCMPSIGSWCVIINFSIILVIKTALLKSDVFRHSKGYSPHSFEPTGIGLGSLWRGNRCVLLIISAYLEIGIYFFLQIFKVVYFAKKNAHFKKFLKIYYSFFFKKR